MAIRTLPLAEAQDLVAHALVANRTSATNARAVARALVLAEADGQKGHGFSRLADYAAQARRGKVDGAAVPEACCTAPAVVAVDARHGFAYPALDLAIERSVPLARAQGVALAGVHRSHHCGAVSLVVERLADADLAGLMFADTPSAIAPWGGRRALFGTNPIGCAFPWPGRDPVVVDFSPSKVARGRILTAQQRGEPIPRDWALDAEGQPTTKPDVALAGTTLPIGKAKGAALALMVEALAAGITGARFAFEASSFLDADGASPGTGQLPIAIDPKALGSERVLDHLAGLFGAVADEAGARLPGRRRLTLRRQAEVEGLMVPASVFDLAGVD